MGMPFLTTYEDALQRANQFVKSRPVGSSFDQGAIRGCVESALREVVAARTEVRHM